MTDPTRETAASAAEAHAIELGVALKAMVVMSDRGDNPRKFDEFLSWRANDELARSLADAALATLPAHALERARTKDDCVDICRDFVRRSDEAELDSPHTYSLCKMALGRLDTFDQENGST